MVVKTIKVARVVVASRARRRQSPFRSLPIFGFEWLVRLNYLLMSVVSCEHL